MHTAVPVYAYNTSYHFPRSAYTYKTNPQLTNALQTVQDQLDVMPTPTSSSSSLRLAKWATVALVSLAGFWLANRTGLFHKVLERFPTLSNLFSQASS